MKTIGLDLGTTTICGVLIDGQTGVLLRSRTLENDAAIAASEPWARCQDPRRILEFCRSIVAEFTTEYPDVGGIGFSNQMHGVVYLNDAGEPLSPLYTWQDERGNLTHPQGGTYAQALTELTGYPMSTGYGLTTHFYNLQNNLVPQGTRWLCTIGDYAAMALCGTASPRMHASNAASFGLFHREAGTFDTAALSKAGIEPALLPQVCTDAAAAGSYGNIPVSVALGDNQASFFGTVREADSLSVSVGTSGQVSMLASALPPNSGAELRPFVGGSHIAVGCSLCAGDAYAALRRFYAETAKLLGGSTENLYEKMNHAAAQQYGQEQGLAVCTQFRGTRQNPALRGSVTGITPDNLTPGHLTLGVLQGICRELYEQFLAMEPAATPRRLIASGNGLRKNPLLRRIFQDTFHLPLEVPLYEEEAAYGAALLSLYVSGAVPSPEAARQLITYADPQ